MRYVDCYRILDQLPDAYPRKVEHLQTLTGNPALANDRARAAFIAEVDAEWSREFRSIRAFHLDFHDPKYFEYHQFRRERGEVAAYYWILAEWRDRAKVNATRDAESRRAEFIQQIWASVHSKSLAAEPA